MVGRGVRAPGTHVTLLVAGFWMAACSSSANRKQSACTASNEVTKNIDRIIEEMRWLTEGSEGPGPDFAFPFGNPFPRGRKPAEGWTVREYPRPWHELRVHLEFPRRRTEFRYGWLVSRDRYMRPNPLAFACRDDPPEEPIDRRPMPMDVNVLVYAECKMDGRTRYLWKDYWYSFLGWRVSRLTDEVRRTPPTPLYDEPLPERLPGS